ncbi:hypothetical protein KKG52_01010 [Patescibacteria group bacterium]|nr:hypothetical protein [Patescibacteria group bacterium]
MQDLNNTDEIKKLDPQGTYESTDLMVKQLKGAWKEVNTIKIPSDYKNVKKVVFCGMGASIYGALVLKALLGKNITFPTETVTDYHLPEYAKEDTLVVLTSYSGNTEEVLSCAEDTLVKKCKALILTKGGRLAEFAKKNNVPAYVFDGKLNPSGVPRLGNGYSVLGLIGLLNNAGIISIEDKQIDEALIRLGDKYQDLKKRAMVDSEKYLDKIPVIFCAEHLSGNAQILRNQFNETSKTFSAYYLIPDLNHHLMEGLQFPNNSKLVFLIIDSQDYSPKARKRVELTKDVILKNNHEILEFKTSGQTIYDDFLEVLIYGSYLSLFVALRYNQNPAINPWVDYFKQNLSS